MSEPSNPQFTYPTARFATGLLGLLICAVLIEYIDQQVFVFLVTPIKAQFSLSDGQVGLMQGMGLRLGMALGALPIGLLIDRTSRVRLLLFAAIGWSSFTALCGFSHEFWQLLACRIGVGASAVGLQSIAYSLIADLYPPHRRPAAIGVFFVGVLLGAAAASYLSGELIDAITRSRGELPAVFATVATWRLTFLAAAALGFALIPFIALAKEPTRNLALPVGTTESTANLRGFLRSNRKIALWVLTTWFLTVLGFNGIYFWLPTILTREYGFSPSEAGRAFGLTFGASAICGTVIAVLLTRLLGGRSDGTAVVRVYRIGLLVMASTLPLAFFTQGSSSLLCLWTIYNFANYVAAASFPALITNFAPNNLRGKLFAIANLGATVPALMAAPPIVGLLADSVFTQHQGLVRASAALGLFVFLLAPLFLLPVRAGFRAAENTT